MGHRRGILGPLETFAFPMPRRGSAYTPHVQRLPTVEKFFHERDARKITRGKAYPRSLEHGGRELSTALSYKDPQRITPPELSWLFYRVCSAATATATARISYRLEAF
jgi:hypothetical protein